MSGKHSVSCTRRSNGPAVRAAGAVRSVATGYHIMVERQSKAPLGSGESTRATSNGVNFRDLSVTVLRLRTHNLARGHRHMFGRSDNCRIDAVSIGRDPMSRPCASGRRQCQDRGRRELTDMGTDSRNALSEGGRSDGVIPLERTLEGYLLLCRRREGKRRQNQRRHREIDIGYLDNEFPFG